MRHLVSIKSALVLASSLSVTLAGRDVNGKIVKALGDDVPIDNPHQFWSQLHDCPLSCGNDGPEKWAGYSSIDEISTCKESMLLDFNIYTPIDRNNFVRFFACTTSNHTQKAPAAQKYLEKDVFTPLVKKSKQVSCHDNLETTTVPVPLVQSGQVASQQVRDHTLDSLKSLQMQVKSHKDCEPTVRFAYSNGTVVGIYASPAVAKSSVNSWIDVLSTHVKTNGHSQRTVSQLCSSKSGYEADIVGISISTKGDFAAVQKDLASWGRRKCVSVTGTETKLSSIKIQQVKANASHSNTATNGTFTNGTLSNGHPANYNATHRSSNAKPKVAQQLAAQGSGICDTYYVQSGDNCYDIAAAKGITMEDLEKYNDKTTWGWTGCNDLKAYINICISSGNPPLPAPVSNAICGPTVPGTQAPTDGTLLADLNPCPLNACCNIWGQCGISGEFCEVRKGPTGNPGTSEKNFNGCVSSCGFAITNDDAPPPEPFGRIGYYETWNFDRSCLYMRARDAGSTAEGYTIIHWAFAELDTSNWSIRINNTHGQWDDFKALTGVKRVVSLGGWGYSTEPASYDNLRKAMSPANRVQFATNVAKFVSDEGIDGVDFDWEYPGAMDIDGTPPGQADDGINYFKFLATQKSKLGSGKTLSIAAPASYWYLKNFPIDKMAKFLDYIVYMTYDLHGQWDVGNKWTMEGCPEGNCLRSHVNMTETIYTLGMITKAGVPTNKIFVGESSYGRSFKMASQGCVGPDCKFLGARGNSQAAKGRCTDTAGYISNAEISEILVSRGSKAKTWYQTSSGSNILVYDDTEWVAYMDDDTKDARRSAWQQFHFRGTIDWAIDLQEFGDAEFDPFDEIPDTIDGSVDLPDCKGGPYSKVEDVPSDVHPYCQNIYLLQALKSNITGSLDQYDKLLGEDYEKKFKTYAAAVAKSGNKAIEHFMWTKANNFFNCEVTERVVCCDQCRDFYAGLHSKNIDKNCQYCGGGCGGWSPHCDDGEVSTCGDSPEKFIHNNVSCPPDYSKRSDDGVTQSNPYTSSSVRWSLPDDYKDKFFAALLSDTGIEEKNVQFKDIQRYDCIGGALQTKEECEAYYHDWNFPITKDYTANDIKNPEDLVKKAYSNFTGIGPQLDKVIDQLKDKKYLGSSYDMVNVISFTADTLSSAVSNMQIIEDTVDKWDDDKRKNIIIAFLTAIFLFIPVVGEVVGAIAEVANLARIAALAGTIGNVALDVYDIVQNKDNPALAIFSLIMEPLGLLDTFKVSKAAARSRAMSAEERATLRATPKGLKNTGDKIDDVRDAGKTCSIKKKKRSPLERSFGAMAMTNLDGLEIWPPVYA